MKRPISSLFSCLSENYSECIIINIVYTKDDKLMHNCTNKCSAVRCCFCLFCFNESRYMCSSNSQFKLAPKIHFPCGYLFLDNFSNFILAWSKGKFNGNFCWIIWTEHIYMEIHQFCVLSLIFFVHYWKIFLCQVSLISL